MQSVHVLPTTAGRELADSIDALRGETAALAAAGLLASSLDGLLGDPGPLLRWVDDLRERCQAGEDWVTVMPVPDDGSLQQVAYGLSALLVWATALRIEGRLASPIPPLALQALDVVEEAAGLVGRTRRAIADMTPATVSLDDPTVLVA